MPFVQVGKIKLYYEETGQGDPVVFVHEFAGDLRSWEPQMRRLGRRYRCIAFNARGYPPSDVPEGWQDYGQDAAAEDVAGLIRGLELGQAHVVGCSMGAFATLHVGLKFPELARSLVVVGAGYGARLDLRERFQREANAVADRIEAEGMAEVAKTYMTSPARTAFRAKDPRGFAESYRFFSEHSARGSANTMRGYQGRRPSLYSLEDEFRKLKVPTLLVIGDEDDPGLDANLFLKRTIPGAGLAVLPRTGHAANLEEPDHFHRLMEDFFAQVENGAWSLRNLDTASPNDILGMGRQK